MEIIVVLLLLIAVIYLRYDPTIYKTGNWVIFSWIQRDLTDEPVCREFKVFNIRKRKFIK